MKKRKQDSILPPKGERCIRLTENELENLMEITLEVGQFLCSDRAKEPLPGCSTWEIYKSCALKWAMEFEDEIDASADYHDSICVFTGKKLIEEGVLEEIPEKQEQKVSI